MGFFHERSGSTSGDEGSAVSTGGNIRTHRRRDSWLAQVRNLFSPTSPIASSERSDNRREAASPLAHTLSGLKLSSDGEDSRRDSRTQGRIVGPIDIGVETDIVLWEVHGQGRACNYLNKEVQVELREEVYVVAPPGVIPNDNAADRTYSPIPTSFHHHHARKKAAEVSVLAATTKVSSPTVNVTATSPDTEVTFPPNPTQPISILKGSSLTKTPDGVNSSDANTDQGLSTSPSSNRILSRRKKPCPGERHIRFSNFACLLDAAWQGDLGEVRKMIEEEGVSPDACNADGVTALHCAAASANYPMVEYLLEAGANVNVADDHGWTPLHSAAYNNHHETVELLLAYGADVEALDSQGQTPISLPTDIEMIRTFGEIVSRKNSAEWLVALYDFCAEDVENGEGDELDFCRGERLRILRRDNTNWWLAESDDGSRSGYVPRQFIQ